MTRELFGNGLLVEDGVAVRDVDRAPADCARWGPLVEDGVAHREADRAAADRAPADDSAAPGGGSVCEPAAAVCERLEAKLPVDEIDLANAHVAEAAAVAKSAREYAAEARDATRGHLPIICSALGSAVLKWLLKRQWCETNAFAQSTNPMCLRPLSCGVRL